MSEWQPIETAPKMEFDVILLGRAGKLHTTPYFWDGENWKCATIFGRDFTYSEPTHWMALPPGPKMDKSP